MHLFDKKRFLLAMDLYNNSQAINFIPSEIISHLLFVCIVVKKWVAEFEKPKGNPTAFLKPATTVLSPYLKVSSGYKIFLVIIGNKDDDIYSHSLVLVNQFIVWYMLAFKDLYNTNLVGMYMACASP